MRKSLWPHENPNIDRDNKDAHEYNGRWFNSIRAYYVRPVDGQPQAAVNANTDDAMPMPEAPIVDSAEPAGDSAEDLPF